MKTILFALSLLFPFLLQAQGYSVASNELVTGLKKEGKTLDLSSTTWRSDAKVIFTGINATQFSQIEVKLTSNKTVNIKSEPDANDGNKIFLLDKTIDKVKEANFTIFFQGSEIGSASFTLKGSSPATTATTTTTTSTKSKDDTPSFDDLFQSYVGAFASANMIGDNKFLSNLTPVVNLGGITPIITKHTKIDSVTRKVTWDLDVNPYLGAIIDLKDSASYIAGLMLYGRAGISINNYINAEFGNFKLTLMPFGFGLKAIPNFQDSSTTLIQHNIRFGLAFSLANTLALSGQLTQGWHNFSSQSEKNYQKVFGNTSTDITYLTVTLQVALRGKKDEVTNYVFIEWRDLLSKSHYENFTNNRIFTIGLKKTLDLTSGIFSADNHNRRTSSSRNVMRGTL